MSKNKYLYLYVLQANYGYDHGWEDVTESEDWRVARRDLREYQENMGQYPHRIIKRREKADGGEV